MIAQLAAGAGFVVVDVASNPERRFGDFRPDFVPERWAVVPSLPHLEASTRGAVRVASTGRLLPQNVCNREGHLTVYTRDGAGRPVRRLVHRLVLEAFRGPAAPGQIARHLHGVAGYNALSGLVWGTSSENSQDAVRHGTHWKGGRHRTLIGPRLPSGRFRKTHRRLPEVAAPLASTVEVAE